LRQAAALAAPRRYRDITDAQATTPAAASYRHTVEETAVASAALSLFRHAADAIRAMAALRASQPPPRRAGQQQLCCATASRRQRSQRRVGCQRWRASPVQYVRRPPAAKAPEQCGVTNMLLPAFVNTADDDAIAADISRRAPPRRAAARPRRSR